MHLSIPTQLFKVSGFLEGAAMPRFYFHILSNGMTVPDDEGIDLPDIMAAHTEAFASARDLALSHDRNGFGKETRSVQIADAAGTVLDTIPVQSDGQGKR
jgi:hypothetical protein